MDPALKRVRDEQARPAITAFEANYRASVHVWESRAMNIYVAYTRGDGATEYRAIIDYDGDVIQRI